MNITSAPNATYLKMGLFNSIGTLWANQFYTTKQPAVSALCKR